jgi:hypothetical protein
MMHCRIQYTHWLSDGRDDSCSVEVDRDISAERINWWETAISVYCPRNFRSVSPEPSR